MAERSYTHRLMLLHPNGPCVRTLEAENGRQLPHFSPSDGFFALTEEVIEFARTTFGVRITAQLEPASKWEFEDEGAAYLRKLVAKLKKRLEV